MMSLFNAVPAGAIKVIVNKEPWFKRADLGRYLGIKNIRDNFKNLVEKPRTRKQLIGVGGTDTIGKGQNDHDCFVTLDGALEIVVKSNKPRAVELAKWLTKKGVEKVVEQHQQAIKEQDAQLALLHDDLTESQNQVSLLHSDLQDRDQEIEDLRRRAVPQLSDKKKMNGLVIIQKNNGDSYPYVAICGQQGYVAQKIQNKLADYPNGHIVVLAETGNAIIHYNWLRERGLIVANPDRVRHFRLGKNYTQQRLMELQEA